MAVIFLYFYKYLPFYSKSILLVATLIYLSEDEELITTVSEVEPKILAHPDKKGKRQYIKNLNLFMFYPIMILIFYIKIIKNQVF